MALFKNLKKIKEQIAAGMNATLSEEQLAALTPEQREAYQQAMGGAANGGVSIGAPAHPPHSAEYDQLVEHQMASRVLGGPAGTALYGGDPRDLSQELHQTLQQEGLMAYMKANWNATGAAGRAERARAEMPVPEAAFADPAQQQHQEWTQREHARAPYLAPARFPVLFTRIATRAGDAESDVRRHLAESGLAGRPELVFGVYPVPAHIGGGLVTRKRRYMEWDVVHAAADPLPPSPQPGSTWIDGAERWVARASGEPSVLDEDLAITLLQAADVGPERCTGIARSFVSVAGGGGEDSESYVLAAATGVHLFHPPDGAVQATLDQMRAARPIVLRSGPPPGVHVEVLNWREIAAVIQGRTGIAHLVPSPFPYLPSTPQELIKAYIDIVGVNPFDCYGTSVSENGSRSIKDRDGSGRFLSVEKTTGATQACVDGKARPRLTAGSVVVVAYRDRPEYAHGRERWAAYSSDVLQARLTIGTGAREPVTAMELGSLGSGTRKVIQGAEKVADFFAGDGTELMGIRGQTPHRYCWPPTDIG